MMTAEEVKDCFAKLRLSKKEIIDLFGVHRRTIERWLKDGISEITPSSMIAALRLRSMMHLKMVKESPNLEHYGLTVGEFVSHYRKTGLFNKEEK